MIGGGHSHIQVLKTLSEQAAKPFEVILVTNVIETPYSGMLPGQLAGWYEQSETHFNLLKVCAQSQTTLIQATVTGIDPTKKVVHLAGRPPLDYDFCSINVGVRPWQPRGCENNPFVMAVKPISEILSRWKSMDDSLPKRVLVVGAGAAGFEISNIVNARTPATEVSLIDSGSLVLPTFGSSTRQKAEKILRRNSITTLLNHKLIEVQDQKAIFENQPEILFDRMILSTGALAPAWFKETSLDLSQDGYLLVDETLKTSDPFIFAAGDCIHFSPHPLPKSGVFAVRQGPILTENLLAQAQGNGLQSYRPQKRSLALLVSAKKRALFSYGPISFESAAAWTLKDLIDRRFMRMFGGMEPAMQSLPGDAENTCGGCGGKVESQIVQNAVQNLKLDPEIKKLLPLHIDDVGEFQNLAVSIDGFRSFTQDLFLFGKIATLHALNDIWASGSVPNAITVQVNLPEMPPLQRSRHLKEMMEGVFEVLKKWNIQLLNAHTSESVEYSISMTSIGQIKNRWRKSPLGRNLSLILTKPVGSGVYLQALMKGQLTQRGWSELKAHLEQDHGDWAMKTTVPIQNSTDISGFGLWGHLQEMLGDELELKDLKIGQVPELSEFNHYLALGNQPHLLASNQKSLFPNNFTLADCGFDPQTNGPLLLAVEINQAKRLVQELQDCGFLKAQIIGQT